MNDNLTVTVCPRCGGSGKTLNEWSNMTKIVIGQSDYDQCTVCEGSGRVFVVPARVIGPYKEKEGGGS